MRRKETKVAKLKKQFKKFVNTFNIHEKMVKDIHTKTKYVEDLSEKIELASKKLSKMERLVEHNTEIYKELEELKNLATYTNGKRVAKELDIYKKQIKHLASLTEAHQEHTKQTSFTSEILQLQETKLKKTFHPVKLVKNYKKYKIEKDEYKE